MTINSEPGYQLVLPNGKPYTDNGATVFPLHRAKVVARNIAMKRKCVVALHKVEEIVNWDTTYDQIQSYVDSLKGKALTEEIIRQGLPVGGDPVASKRIRLVSHFVKKGSR